MDTKRRMFLLTTVAAGPEVLDELGERRARVAGTVEHVVKRTHRIKVSATPGDPATRSPYARATR